MRISATHTSTYRYDQPLAGGLQELRLTPRSDGRQRIESWNLKLEGAMEEVTFTDHHGNTVQLVSLEPGVESTIIACRGVVETEDTAGVVAHRGAAPLWIYNRSTELTEPGDRVADLVARFKADEVGDSEAGAREVGGSEVGAQDPIATMHALSAFVRSNIDYDLGWTDTASSADEVIEAGRGVCQDHSHVFLAAARSLGHQARYVSGYLMMDGQVDQDATHAWAEVWIQGLGWVGFDVANGLSPDDRYVRLAVGLDYSEAAPISGLRYGTVAEELEVALQVQQQ